MVVLVAARADRSPAMRCEKNSMGRCRTFHMNDELDTTAILPSRRSRYMAFSTSTTMAHRSHGYQQGNEGVQPFRVLPTQQPIHEHLGERRIDDADDGRHRRRDGHERERGARAL